MVSVPQAQCSNFKFENHPFINVLTKTTVLKQLCSFLKSSDIFNLYQIIKKSDFIASSFLKTAFHRSLEVSGPWFTGTNAIDYFNQIVRTVNPPNIIFQNFEQTIGSSIALKFLTIVVKENKSDVNVEFVRIKVLVLSGIKVTKSLIKYISENFKIKSLKVSKTTAQFDQYFQIEGLENFKVVDNNDYVATNLKIINFVNLSTLELVNCQRLSLGRLTDFVTRAQNLKKLIMIDCITDERNLHLKLFLESVFSDKTNLNEFKFKFSSSDSIMVSNFFQLEPPLLCNLKTLDLQNSGFLLFHMQSIVNSMQLLEYLNIKGIAVPLTLNLSRLVSLKALDIEYFQGVTQVVRTIQSSCFYRLNIVNRWSKKNKKKTLRNYLAGYSVNRK